MNKKKRDGSSPEKLTVDYDAAAEALRGAFADAETYVLGSSAPPAIDPALGKQCEKLFQSKTQSFREVLVGATICRLLDKRINIRTPYAKHGDTAVSQRVLDERVVNPFLKSNRIPSSKGPYLAVFRRGVDFYRNAEGTGTRGGVRDAEAFDAFDVCLTFLEGTSDNAEIRSFLVFVLYQFVLLREAANVPLARLQRISLEQCHELAIQLMGRRSGGRFPLFLVVAAFTAIKECLNAPWELSWQQINVADSAAGAVGDLELIGDGRIILAGEITERSLDRDRIVSTFTTKIVEAGVTDYLFLVTKPPADDAKQQCFCYFAQGHEINFVEIASWIHMILATLGTGGRRLFEARMADLLGQPDVPKSLKVDWNDCIAFIANRMR
ncbi:MAG TPA: hypothetical protein VF278_10445 [Pirellulales bacterium]